jgi:hypothetical protein
MTAPIKESALRGLLQLVLRLVQEVTGIVPFVQLRF